MAYITEGVVGHYRSFGFTLSEMGSFFRIPSGGMAWFRFLMFYKTHSQWYNENRLYEGRGGSRETTVIQVRDGGGLDQGGSSKDLDR